MQQQLMLSVSNMLIALLATMARIDNDKRIERIKQDTNWLEATREADQLTKLSQDLLEMTPYNNSSRVGI